MEAQLQIRQNALEVQDYMRDLLDWQKTMNNKATSSSKQSAECLDIPAVRGRAGSSSVRAPAEAMQQPALLPRGTQSPHNGVSAAHPASHTYKNYSKWDKFDVDAALEEQDLLKPDITRPSKHQQPSQSSQAVLPAQQQPAAAKATAAAAAKATAAAAAKATAAAAAAASVSNQTKAAGKAAAGSDRAAALKDQGNKLFQAGYYDEAIDCYNQSIDILPTSVAFANRAMALLKQKKYQQVDQDCTAALLLDAGYVKALHRRGTARLHMGQLLAAAMDFESALCLEPHNKAIQMDRDDALAKHCQAENINTQSSSWTSIPVTVHQPLQQQAQQQPNRQPTQQPTQQPKLQQQKQKDFADGPQTPGALPSGASSSSVIHRPIRPASPGSSTGGSSRVSPRDDRQAAATAAATTSAAQLAAARLTSSIRPPKTSSDFEAAWRSFKGDLQLQAKYLKLIQPQQLPAILKNSLTASLLTSILSVALAAAAGGPDTATASVGAPGSGASGSSSTALDVPHAVQLMEQLVQVPRFAMTVMCLTGKDKAALKQSWNAAAAAADLGLQKQLASLRTSYNL